jgi:hypothetical protein
MSFARTIYKRLLYIGFDAKRFLEALSPKKSSWYEHDFLELKKQKGSDQTFYFGTPFPILTDKDDQGGVMKGHYFHQDLFIARRIHQASPEKHVDIGSRIDGFVAHLASFRKVEVFDIRPNNFQFHNIIFKWYFYNQAWLYVHFFYSLLLLSSTQLELMNNFLMGIARLDHINMEVLGE